LPDVLAAGCKPSVGKAYMRACAQRAQACEIKRLTSRHTPCLATPIAPHAGVPPSRTMTDFIAGLCVVLLLAALCAMRRRARRARSKRLNSPARLQQGRTFSARTQMRGCHNPTTTLGMPKKGSLHAATEDWKKA
jgi:hypothetical protein